MHSSQSISAAIGQNARALVVASFANEILFATPNARVWLRRFFPADRGENMLPPRVGRWLQTRRSPASPFIRARRAGSSLLVSKYAPQPGECIALLLELVDKSTPQPPTKSRLSRRQQDVLRWVASGKSNKGIAQILNISPKTVGKHVENVFRKLGVTNRIAAANAYTGYPGERH